MPFSDFSEAKQFRIMMEASGAHISGEHWKKPGLPVIKDIEEIRERQKEERAAREQEMQYQKIQELQDIKAAQDRRDARRNDPKAYKGTMKQTPESQEAVRRIALQARSEKANRKAIESTISHKAKRTKPVERPGIHFNCQKGSPGRNGKPTKFREPVINLSDPPASYPGPGESEFIARSLPTSSTSPPKPSPPSPQSQPQSPQSSRATGSVLGKRKAPADPLFMNAAKRSLSYRGPMCTPVIGANTGDKMATSNSLPKFRPQTKPTTVDHHKPKPLGKAEEDQEKKLPVKKLSLADYAKRRKDGE